MSLSNWWRNEWRWRLIRLYRAMRPCLVRHFAGPKLRYKTNLLKKQEFSGISAKNVFEAWNTLSTFRCILRNHDHLYACLQITLRMLTDDFAHACRPCIGSGLASDCEHNYVCNPGTACKEHVINKYFPVFINGIHYTPLFATIWRDFSLYNNAFTFNCSLF